MFQSCKILNVLREPTILGPFENKVVKIQSTDEKFKDFPPLIIYESTCKVLDKLKNFKVYEDDVYLCGYLRSGTTLMAEMIWLILHDFDFQGAKDVIQSYRFPYFEFYDVRKSLPGNEHLPELEDLQRPRTMKTHAPVHFLPDDIYKVKPKIIHMSRNVKDVATSVYHFQNDMLNEVKISFEEFLSRFMNDEIVFTPYREHLSYFKHMDYENILHLTYESVTSDITAAIYRVANFLGKEVSEENLKLLKEHLKFDSMKKNKSVNHEEWLKKVHKIYGKTDANTDGFIRKGLTGGHKHEITAELAEKLDKWMKEMH